MDEIKNMLKIFINSIHIVIPEHQEETLLYNENSPVLIFHNVYDAYYSGRRDGTAILAKQILEDLEKWGY